MVIIGLSTNRDTANGRDWMPRDYVLSVLRAGALPVILPMIPEDDPNYDELMDKTIRLVDGIVFTGGPDIHPKYYGETLLPDCHEPVSDRDKADLALILRAVAVRKPFLGICRGIQVVNVALGGSLYQDLPSQLNPGVNHSQPDTLLAHRVSLAEGSLLHTLTGAASLEVTSRHHQAVKEPAPGLMVTALSEDGVIEALEYEDGRPMLCVQWHPENLAKSNPAHQSLFDWLVREAERRG